MKKRTKALAAVAISASMLVNTLPASAAKAADTEEKMLSVSYASKGKPEFSAKQVPFYLIVPDQKYDMTLVFVNGQKDIPYIDIGSVMEALDMMSSVFRFEAEYKLDNDTEGKVMTITRENGAKAVLDFNKGEIYYSDRNRFNIAAIAKSIIDPDPGNYTSEEDGSPMYVKRQEPAFQRSGSPVTISLSDYDIPMYYDEDMGCIPLQTFSDLFMAPYTMSVLYNGKEVFFVQGDEMHPKLEKKYYSAKTGSVSPELCEFSYNELCMALDVNYGLKELHGIDSFDEMFRLSGLDKKLKSGNAVQMEKALDELLHGYLDDNHCKYLAPSFYAGRDADHRSKNSHLSYDKMVANYDTFTAARAKLYPDGVPGYEEIDNTAYITFDGFVANTRDYYSEPPTSPEGLDTIGLLIYAHSQIKRENSPIENVVIDLSANRGGSAKAAIYVLSWLTGTAQFGVADPITGAKAVPRWKADLNLDKKFTDEDNIADKNIYVLISPVSFSCGNLVPSVLKQVTNVTLLGQTSGGGACPVLSLSTAFGSRIRISMNLVLSNVKNGSFYDIDTGAEPDVYIGKYSDYYDRAKLTDFINGLL